MTICSIQAIVVRDIIIGLIIATRVQLVHLSAAIPSKTKKRG